MEEEVKKIISETFFIDIEDIKLESNLKNDLDIDSLAATNFILDLEEKYNIRFENSEISQLITVADVLKVMENKGVKIGKD